VDNLSFDSLASHCLPPPPPPPTLGESVVVKIALSLGPPCPAPLPPSTIHEQNNSFSFLKSTEPTPMYAVHSLHALPSVMK